MQKVFCIIPGDGQEGGRKGDSSDTVQTEAQVRLQMKLHLYAEAVECGG